MEILQFVVFLISLIVSLLSFAWGLYVTVDGKVDAKFNVPGLPPTLKSA